MAKKVMEPSLQKELKQMQRRALLQIFTVGKTGAGKSSLISDLVGPSAIEKPKVGAGWAPVTTESHKYEVQVEKGVSSVFVYDTRGMFDAVAGGHEETTMSSLHKVCSNDVSGMLIVCIPMHDRLDESAVETIATLYNKFGKDIWKKSVIALTKADEYPRDEWLVSKKWFNKAEPILKSEFERYLQKCKDILRENFTLSKDKARERSYIGMSVKEYDELEIPILPTSTLSSRDHLSKMRAVGHEYWFDLLLVECCKRERGMTLVNIHSKRLNNLPDEIVRQIDPTGVLGPDFIVLVQTFLKTVGEKSSLLIAWNVYQHYKYSRNVVQAPRFEAIVRKGRYS